MGKAQAVIDDSVKQFIERQTMFFVATAPLDPNGLVNLSPKGLDSIRILAPDTIAYLDLTGSGVETIAHYLEKYCAGIVANKRAAAPPGCPLLVR